MYFVVISTCIFWRIYICCNVSRVFRVEFVVFFIVLITVFTSILFLICNLVWCWWVTSMMLIFGVEVTWILHGIRFWRTVLPSPFCSLKQAWRPSLLLCWSQASLRQHCCHRVLSWNPMTMHSPSKWICRRILCKRRTHRQAANILNKSFCRTLWRDSEERRMSWVGVTKRLSKSFWKPVEPLLKWADKQICFSTIVRD